MRDVPIPMPPDDAPEPPVAGARMVWAPWAGQWQVFSAPCPDCLRVAPVVFPEGVCWSCANLIRRTDRLAAIRYGSRV